MGNICWCIAAGAAGHMSHMKGFLYRGCILSFPGHRKIFSSRRASENISKGLICPVQRRLSSYFGRGTGHKARGLSSEWFLQVMTTTYPVFS